MFTFKNKIKNNNDLLSILKIRNINDLLTIIK